jgi:hypothetical protein
MPLDARGKGARIGAGASCLRTRGATRVLPRGRLQGRAERGRSLRRRCHPAGEQTAARLADLDYATCWQVVENLRDLVGDAPRVERGALLHNAGVGVSAAKRKDLISPVPQTVRRRGRDLRVTTALVRREVYFIAIFGSDFRRTFGAISDSYALIQINPRRRRGRSRPPGRRDPRSPPCREQRNSISPMTSHQQADYYSPQAGSGQNRLDTCGAIKEPLRTKNSQQKPKTTT